MIAQVTADAWVNEAAPAAGHAQAARLWLNGGAGADTRYAYLFIARPFPFGATIISATLKVYLNGTWSSGTITAKRITETWKEGTISWNNKPAVSATNSATSATVSGTDGTEVTMDISAMLGDVSGGAAWFGVRLEYSADATRALYSSEHVTAEYRPMLDLEWSEGPEPPSNLSPGGGRAVSVTSPVLSWQFTDNLGATTQASSQVQISTTTDFSSPAYDSTKVANTESTWDLDGLYTLANDDVRYWRVRVWDGTDIPSEYSAAEEFTRKTDGTLTITNPPAAPAQVEETTPPITWTFTGRTQEQYRVLLYRVNTNGSITLVASKGWTVGTATSWTVPSKKIKQGYTYRVIVEVKDTLDRETITGDLDKVFASRDFIFVPGGPAAIETLTATVTKTPAVTLNWTRTATPDYFALIVDGEEVEDRIVPSDVFKDTSEWEMEYWGATPRSEHTYEVSAVVLTGGEYLHSASNPEASVTTIPIGIWLADPDDGANVQILGAEEGSISIGESGETFNLIGSRAPVRVTDAIRGYEGSVDGTLHSAADRDTFLEIKGRLAPVRIILSDVNILADLGPVSASPTPIPDSEGVYNCSLEFTQTGEFSFEVVGTHWIAERDD